MRPILYSTDPTFEAEARLADDLTLLATSLERACPPGTLSGSEAIEVAIGALNALASHYSRPASTAWLVDAGNDIHALLAALGGAYLRRFGIVLEAALCSIAVPAPTSRALRTLVADILRASVRSSGARPPARIVFELWAADGELGLITSFYPASPPLGMLGDDIEPALERLTLLGGSVTTVVDPSTRNTVIDVRLPGPPRPGNDNVDGLRSVWD